MKTSTSRKKHSDTDRSRDYLSDDCKTYLGRKIITTAEAARLLGVDRRAVGPALAKAAINAAQINIIRERLLPDGTKRYAVRFFLDDIMLARKVLQRWLLSND
jgi:hypothetical protein